MVQTDKLREHLTNSNINYTKNDNNKCRETYWNGNFGDAYFYEDLTNGYTSFEVESDMHVPERIFSYTSAIAATT